MGSNLSSKTYFYFVCTNYGSHKDGIGHFTSKIVDELSKNESFILKVYSSKTHHLTKLRLFFSIRMSLKLLRLVKELGKSKSYIVIEYPFVEYNPLFYLFLKLLKFSKGKKNKIVISLHEYSRTKKSRKLFTRLLIPLSDIVLFTKKEDIQPFVNKKIRFVPRIIPANIEPDTVGERVISRNPEVLNICFFGILNFETKSIYNMIKGWERYVNEEKNNRIHFHFISSTFDENINETKNLSYYIDLSDTKVSELLLNMKFIILPLKPKISSNNGSLSVGCIHNCIPVGIFENEYFDEYFGIKMINYSIEEFVRVYKVINRADLELINNKSNLAYEYGRQKSIFKSAQSYSELVKY